VIDCSQYQEVITQQTRLLGMLVLVVNAFGAYIIIRTRRNGSGGDGHASGTQGR
jgi:hypothetical protein